MNIPNRPINPSDASANHQERMLQEALSQAAMPMLRPLLTAFCVASKRISKQQADKLTEHYDKQAREFRQHSDQAFESLFERIGDVERGIGEISHQIGHQNGKLLDSLSGRDAVAADGVCWQTQAGIHPPKPVKSKPVKPYPVQPTPKRNSRGVGKNATEPRPTPERRGGTRIQPMRACKLTA
ncbi:hypothetical protein MAN_10528, partial [Metarhizium hybridum]|uniref:Uncharacterized protein n=2 Tax=Metarhizium TaxID=5529 RepID=A0A5C6FXX7_METRR